MQYKQIIEEIEIELKRIEKLFEEYNPLFKKVKDRNQILSS